MKNNRYIALVILVFIAIVLQLTTQVNEIFLILLLSASFVAIWLFYDHKDQVMARKEYKEMQEKIKSTSKDVHLKNKQLLTIVGSMPYPLLLLDQFGNVVMSSSIDEISDGETFEDMNYMKNNFVDPVKEFIKDSFIMEKQVDKILRINDIEYQSISIPVTAKQHYRGCLFLFQDVSKTLEGEKMQKRFIADASHELKTPIAVIKGMVEILNRDDFDDDETRKEFLDQIESEINRLDNLVKDLLQLSRLSLSNVILKKEKVDMTKVIDKACQSLSKTADKKGLTIVKDYQYRGILTCDESKMFQVMINLLSNAIKYSDTGAITIKTSKENSFYTIEVKDEGHGISLEDQEKIFERFYRVDDDRSRMNGGSGLGLSIVKSAVEAHGGKILVRSQVDEGTSFIVKILI
ncbi:sensor histidine kinase [Amedibacillus sp. YH-ame10]